MPSPNIDQDIPAFLVIPAKAGIPSDPSFILSPPEVDEEFYLERPVILSAVKNSVSNALSWKPKVQDY